MARIDYDKLPPIVQGFMNDIVLLQPTTKQRYAYGITLFGQFMEEKEVPLAQVKKKHVNEYITCLKNKKRKDRYIAFQLRIIRKFIYYLKDELDLEDPVDRRRNRELDKILSIPFRIKHTPDTRKALTDKQVEELFEKVVDPELRGMCVLGLLGFRRIEYTRALISDIDLQKKEILVHGKGQKDRIVWITGLKLEQELERLLKWRKRGIQCDLEYLFPTFYNREWGQAKTVTIDRRFKRICDRLSFRFSSHQLRFTYATKLWRVGVEIVVIQELLGHADINQTRKYLRIEKKELESRYRRSMRGVSIF